MAATLGIESRIVVPNWLDETTKDLIRMEGAEVIVDSGDYDQSILTAEEKANVAGGILIQDHSFADYLQIPQVLAQQLP